MVWWDLYSVFDRAVGAVLKLMQDSYSRFKETASFKKHEENVKKEMYNKQEVQEEDLGGFMGDLVM